MTVSPLWINRRKINFQSTCGGPKYGVGFLNDVRKKLKMMWGKLDNGCGEKLKKEVGKNVK